MVTKSFKKTDQLKSNSWKSNNIQKLLTSELEGKQSAFLLKLLFCPIM